MNKSKVGIDELNMHLFDVIERLKSNSDTDASDNERIDVETAKAIVDVAKVVIEGYRVKANVLQTMAKTENPLSTSLIIGASGITKTDSVNEGNTLNKALEKT